MTVVRFPFQFVGNNIAIDFINTTAVIGEQQFDFWELPSDLEDWFVAAGLVIDEPLDQKALSKAVKLRTSLFAALTAVIDDVPLKDEDISFINTALKWRVIDEELRLDGTQLVLQPAAYKRTVLRILGDIAYAGAMLLTSKEIGRMKSCANPACVLLFRDISKSGKRKWCSMEICGNREKAARYYRSRLEG